MREVEEKTPRANICCLHLLVQMHNYQVPLTALNALYEIILVVAAWVDLEINGKMGSRCRGRSTEVILISSNSTMAKN